MTSPITRLKACVALGEKATPGPLEKTADGRGYVVKTKAAVRDDLRDVEGMGEKLCGFRRADDADLFVALRNSIPDLSFVLARLEECERALKPFADACAKADESAAEIERARMGKMTDNATPGWGIRYGHVKAARAALEPKRTITPEG